MLGCTKLSSVFTRNNMRGLLVCIAISLGRYTTSFAELGRVPPLLKPPQHLAFRGEYNGAGFNIPSRSVASPPWLNVRGGDSGSAARTTTSLTSTLIGAVDTFYKTMPLASAFFTCGIKAALADTVAQKRAAKEAVQPEGTTETDSLILGEIEGTPFEKRRNFAFFAYGALYQGVSQEIIFNEVFPAIFGQGTDFPTVISKVLFDSMVITPFLCLPVAYVVKSVIFQYSFKEAMSRYKDDVLNNGLLVKYWSLWAPVQCLTFGVVPQHLRIVFIAFVSFFWLIIFSSIAAKGQKAREEGEGCSLEDGVSCRIDG